HWSAARLVAARSRPDDMLCAASTHDMSELEQAARLGVDFVVLGPVAATPTHPGARPLGWRRFAELAAGSPMPVYALGGLSAEDLDVAIAHGAHGVALRRDRRRFESARSVPTSPGRRRDRPGLPRRARDTTRPPMRRGR